MTHVHSLPPHQTNPNLILLTLTKMRRRASARLILANFRAGAPFFMARAQQVSSFTIPLRKVLIPEAHFYRVTSERTDAQKRRRNAQRKELNYDDE